MNAAQPEREPFRSRHPVLCYGGIFGIVTGLVLAAAGAGKVIQGQEVLVDFGVVMAAFCYAFAGAFAARPGYSTRDGMLAGLLAGVITAAISAPVDLILTGAFMSVYLPHMESMHSAPGGYLAILTPAQVYGYEVLGVTYGVISAVVAGLGLGWLGGYFGASMRLGWQPVERPTHHAAVPIAPSTESDAAKTPSGPHWEPAHPPSPPTNEPPTWRKH